MSILHFHCCFLWLALAVHARHDQRRRNVVAPAHLAAIGKHQVVDAAAGAAVLVRMADDGHRVTGLDGVLQPAGALQHRNGGALETPGGGLAVHA